MIAKNVLADLIIEADIERAMVTIGEDIKAGKVWFMDLPGRDQIPEDIASMAHRMAIYHVAVSRRGLSARYN